MKAIFKVLIAIFGSLLLFVAIKFLYEANKISTSRAVHICWQNDSLRIELMNSAQYIREIKVLSGSNSDTLVVVPYVTSCMSIFYGKLSYFATLRVEKNVKYLKLGNDSITYDLHKDIKICRLLYQ